MAKARDGEKTWKGKMKERLGRERKKKGKKRMEKGKRDDKWRRGRQGKDENRKEKGKPKMSGEEEWKEIGRGRERGG